MDGETYDLRPPNMRRKMLVVGKTGTGKSTLCNRVAGLDPDANLFPASAGAVSCTQSTKFGNVNFGGSRERPISLIDTIGFDDPNNDTDSKVIAELVDKLMNKCDKVHLFVIAVNGQNPRMDGSLVAMLKIFKEMFGEEFWGQCCVVFTRVPMDKRSINRRLKNGGGQTDEQRAEEYMKVVESKFESARGRNIKYMYLDACFVEDEDDEKEAFDKAMEELYKLIEAHKGLETNTIDKDVQTEHKKIKKQLEEREKAKQEITKEVEAMKNRLEKAEENRKNDEARYQREKEEYEKKMQKLEERGSRQGGDIVREVLHGVLDVGLGFLGGRGGGLFR